MLKNSLIVNKYINKVTGNLKKNSRLLDVENKYFFLICGTIPALKFTNLEFRSTIIMKKMRIIYNEKNHLFQKIEIQ